MLKKHITYPVTKRSDDFWRQVKRTVNGIPVSQEQIDMIVVAVRNALSFSLDDVLLDLGCGNGALSSYFFDNVHQLHGVDISEYLIGIAKEYFEDLPCFSFKKEDIVSFVENTVDTKKFTKCLFYGVFPYLSHKDARVVLDSLARRFHNLQTIFIGNLPDREKTQFFYYKGIDFSLDLDNNNSPIGIWRSKKDFVQLAHKAGWQAEIHTINKDYYAAHYRYDMVLERL